MSKQSTGRGAVSEQRRVLVVGERRRRAAVGGALADQRDPHARERVGERVEDQEPGAGRGVERAVARAGGHQRDRGVAIDEPTRGRGAGRLGEREPERLVRQVGRRRAAGVAAFALGHEVAVARGVVVAHAGEQLELERLVAAPVVDDPRPLARDGVQRAPRRSPPAPRNG